MVRLKSCKYEKACWDVVSWENASREEDVAPQLLHWFHCFIWSWRESGKFLCGDTRYCMLFRLTKILYFNK